MRITPEWLKNKIETGGDEQCEAGLGLGQWGQRNVRHMLTDKNGELWFSIDYKRRPKWDDVNNRPAGTTPSKYHTLSDKQLAELGVFGIINTVERCLKVVQYLANKDQVPGPSFYRISQQRIQTFWFLYTLEGAD